jgi:putative transposase
MHPPAPKVESRAARPDEIWHIDTSVLRLLDGSRACLQAVIDNFSRRVWAWKVSGTFDPNATAAILLTAAQNVSGDKPILVAGGVENINRAVDELMLLLFE